MAITDLKGTTWKLNETLTKGTFNAYNDYFTDVDVNFTFEYSGTIYYGYQILMPTVSNTGSNNQLRFSDYNFIDPDVYNFNTNTYYTDISRIVTFTGGTDTTNASLIAWLTENGELQGEEEKPIFTYDLTQLNLAAGTYSITIVAKAAGYNDAPSNTAQFVVEQESFVEETNEYGTTMVINKYTEEPNEYGTTMIIGGETTT